MTNTASLANLMLQTGMVPDQISQLAQGGGIASSASLANMLGKQRSFDQLMSLDFQSMQSIDNLANLIQQGMPNQGAGLRGTPARSQMKNMDWGTQGNNNNNNIAAPQAILNQAGMGGSSFDALVRTLSATTHSTANSGQSGGSGSGSGGSAFSNTQRTQPNATNFGNLLQNTQGGMGGGQGLSTSAQDFSNILQGLTQQNQQQQQQQGNANVNFNLGMAAGGGNNQGLNQNAASGNMFLNMMTQQMAGGNNMAQHQQQNNLNPLVMQQLAAGNAQFGGQTNQVNPMMALLAQQQLAQTGNNMNNFLAQPQMMNTNPFASQLASLGSTYNPAPPINQAGVANMPTGNSNAMAFLNNLIQQQGSSGTTNNNQASEAPVVTTQDGGGGGDNDGSTLVSNKTESTATSGEKRSIDEVKNDGAQVEDGEPSTKKQNTTEAV